MKKIFLSLFLIYFNSYFLFSQDSANLSVQIQGSTADSLKCTLVYNAITNKTKKFTIERKNNSYTSTVLIDNPVFIHLYDGKYQIEGILEPGDNIKIAYKAINPDSTIEFSGRGSGKFTLIHENNNLSNRKVSQRLKEVEFQSLTPDSYFDLVDSVETALMKKLDKIMFSISSSSYNLLKGEIKGMALYQRYLGVEKGLKSNVKSLATAKTSLLSAKNAQNIESLVDFSDSYYLSPKYLNAVFYILSNEYSAKSVAEKTQKSMKDKFQYFDQHLKGQLKVPVHTKLFLNEMTSNVDQQELYSLITQVFQNNLTSEFKPFLEREYASFKIGKRAPSFSLQGVDGKKINLEDLKGKVVYLNFWFSGNSGCEKLFSKLKLVAENFKDNPDVVFLWVSVDSKELWSRSVKYYGMKGLHGFTEDLSMKHPIISSYHVTKFPTSCVIDRKGNFYSTTPTDNPLELISLIDDALKEQLVMSKTDLGSRNSKN